MTKTNTQTLADLVSGLKEEPAQPTAAGSDLWEEAMRLLADYRPDKETEAKRKLYPIDNDLLATIMACDFKAPVRAVINAILRVFLLSHLDRLQALRKSPQPDLFESNPDIPRL